MVLLIVMGCLVLVLNFWFLILHLDLNFSLLDLNVDCCLLLPCCEYVLGVGRFGSTYRLFVLLALIAASLMCFGLLCTVLCFD